MTANPTCPHCGAEFVVTQFACGSRFDEDTGLLRQSSDCSDAAYVKQRVDKAVLEEREACSDMADQLGTFGYDGHLIAKAIRARGEKK